MFWVNVPLIAVALVAGAVLLRDSRPAVPRRADWPGTLLAAAASWRSSTRSCTRPSAAGWRRPRSRCWRLPSPLGGAFAAWERRAAAPLADPALLRNRRFAWGTVAGVVVSFALYGLLFVLPQFLQSVLGHDALGTGVRLIPLMAGLMAGRRAREPAADCALGTARRGQRRARAARRLAGVARLRHAEHALRGDRARARAPAAPGSARAMAPAMDAVLAELPDGEAGIGAAINNTLRQVGGALGVAAARQPAVGRLSERPRAASRAPAGSRAARDRRRPRRTGSRRRSRFASGMASVLLACAAVVALAAHRLRPAARSRRRPREPARAQEGRDPRSGSRRRPCGCSSAHGYDATTVDQIAEAAGVSHMTFFRNFPAKEDVVATDDYDPLMAELIRARPAGEHPVERVRATVMAGLAAVYERDRDDDPRPRAADPSRRPPCAPASSTTSAPPRRCSPPASATPTTYETRVLAAACVGALVTAVREWAEHPERAELPELVDRAFAALARDAQLSRSSAARTRSGMSRGRRSSRSTNTCTNQPSAAGSGSSSRNSPIS